MFNEMLRGARRLALPAVNASREMAKLALLPLRFLPSAQRADALDLLLSAPIVVKTPRGEIRMLNHGGGSYWRARTLVTKEPDSITWLDAMQPGSVFWDIGANVGFLTLHAAARGDLEVWAFEPAAVNYYNLVANCELNHFEKYVRCLQLGFGDKNEITDLHVSQLMAGHSFSFKAFKESTRIRAWKKSHPSFQAVQVCTIDDFIVRYDVPCPNYIKIDVPGLTYEIFVGARHTLARPELRQIQVEADEHGKDGLRISELLAPYGFKVTGRGMRHKGTIQRDLVFSRVIGDSNPQRLQVLQAQ